MSCAERARRQRRFPLEVRTDRTPDAPALIHPLEGSPRTATFRELERWTRDAALALVGLGVCRGERVALLLPPGPAYPVLLLALLRAGAVAVPFSTRLPAPALAGLLGRIGCRRLITGGEDTPAPPGVETIRTAGLGVTGRGLHPATAPPLPAAANDRGLPPFDPAADATIVFTSGSTGEPKAALHTWDNHRASAAGANRNLPLRPGDRWLLSLPLWHVGGLAVVFRCLAGGAAIALPDGGRPLEESILDLGATHVSLVPTQLHRLLRAQRGRAALRGLTAVLLGGAPVPPRLIGEALGAGIPLVTSYGSTETSSQATATRAGDPPETLRTSGRVLAFRELAFTAGGEILVRGRTLFRGYVEAHTVDPARDAGGWFHTGDLGQLDAEGRLVVTGRRDSMFISGGENIQPEEIEREILRFPGVLETVVVAVPDAEFGARPAAFLRTEDGGVPETAALDRFLRETLPGFKVPQRFLPWPVRMEGLKPDRRALEALARAAPPSGDGRERPPRGGSGRA